MRSVHAVLAGAGYSVAVHVTTRGVPTVSRGRLDADLPGQTSSPAPPVCRKSNPPVCPECAKTRSNDPSSGGRGDTAGTHDLDISTSPALAETVETLQGSFTHQRSAVRYRPRPLPLRLPAASPTLCCAVS
jgi:hypothetical protein